MLAVPFMAVLISCSTVPIITEDAGEVINMGEYWVEVAYPVLNRPDNRRAANIYHKPCGHFFAIGDTYPDKKRDIDCELSRNKRKPKP